MKRLRRTLPPDEGYPDGDHFVELSRVHLFTWRVRVWRCPGDPYVIFTWRFHKRSSAEAKFGSVTAIEAHLAWQERQQARLLAWNRDVRYVDNG